MKVFDYMNPTNYERNEEELLRFWLFCLFVAGKRADVQAKKLAMFEKRLPLVELPGASMKQIGSALRDVKSGKYRLLARGIYETSDQLRFDSQWLKHACVLALEDVCGAGPKTARFFLVHSRRKQHYAVLDTHVIRWLSENGVKVPLRAPSKKEYAELEKKALKLFEKWGFDPAVADIQIWRERTVSKAPATET